VLSRVFLPYRRWNSLVLGSCIPVPAPRTPPPSVIVGPTSQKSASPGRQSPRPMVCPTFPSKAPIKDSTVAVVPEPKPPLIIDKPEVPAVDQKSSETTTPLVPPVEETKEKPAEKPAEGYRKKTGREENWPAFESCCPSVLQPTVIVLSRSNGD